MDSRRAWVNRALAVREKVDRLEFGDRETGLRPVAERIGWSGQTLRRALAAIEFTEHLERETSIPALGLQRFPLAAVEYASRLYRSNPKSALDAIQDLLEGRISVATLKQREETADSIAPKAGKSLEVGFRKSAENAIFEYVRERFAVALKANDCRMHNDPHSIADFVPKHQEKNAIAPQLSPGQKMHRPSLPVAVVIVGPYSDTKLYEQRAFDWIARGNALLSIYDRIVLVLPEHCPSEPFITWSRKVVLQEAVMPLKLAKDGRLF